MTKKSAYAVTPPERIPTLSFCMFPINEQIGNPHSGHLGAFPRH